MVGTEQILAQWKELKTAFFICLGSVMLSKFSCTVDYCLVEEMSWVMTYNWNVSLYLGDQVLLFVFVPCFLFLSPRLGPSIQTSTKGRNMVVVCQFRLLIAITIKQKRGWDDRVLANNRVESVSLPFGSYNEFLFRKMMSEAITCIW